MLKQKSNRQVQTALADAEMASAAKGNFMSRMSHEIRTPLNAVIGYNTIARNVMTEARSEAERRQSEMKVMDCLTKSDIASRHLITIINDVLDMSAIESGKIKVVNERFDFKGLISSLTAIFYSQAKSKDVDFDVQFDAQMDEWVVGDQMRVNQILTNLLSNAVKFTPGGGRVTLFLHPRTEQPQATGPYDFSSINALIVDDDMSTCDYIRLLLTRSGVRSAAGMDDHISKPINLPSLFNTMSNFIHLRETPHPGRQRLVFKWTSRNAHRS